MGVSIIVNALRARDLLNIQFEFIGFSLETAADGGPTLRRGAGDAFIHVRFPSQHIGEEAFEPSQTGTLPGAAFLSSPSRIAFAVPRPHADIPLLVPELLRAVAALTPAARLPDGSIGTVLEFPDRVLLLPADPVRLSPRPVPAEGRSVALFGARLASGTEHTRFTAVANGFDTGERLQRQPLLHRDRTDIAINCAANPGSIRSSGFTLSALGGSARLDAQWEDNAGSDLDTWVQDSVLGRDREVQVVRRGYLFPFGHAASEVVISTRGLRGDFTRTIAELGKRIEVKVLGPQRFYDRRAMPLASIAIVSDLKAVGNLAGRKVHAFDAVATDRLGNVVACPMRAVFVTRREARDAGLVLTLSAQYLAAGHGAVALGSRRIALAQEPDERGGSLLDVATLEFAADPVPGDPGFAPRMERAQVRVPAVDQLQGVAGGTESAGTARWVRHAPGYIRDGLRPDDPRQVFAEYDEPVRALTIPASRAGGLVAPVLPPLDGLSTLLGPVSGARERDATPDVAALIGETRLLGRIALKDIVEVTPDLPPALVGDFDALIRELRDTRTCLARPVMASVRSGAATNVRFAWKPRIRGDLGDGAVIRPWSAKPIELMVWGSIGGAQGAGPPALTMDGRLTNFALALGKLVTVRFNAITFSAPAGRKMSLSPDIEEVILGGDLSFAEEICAQALNMKLPFDATLEPRPDGVTVRYAIALPSVGLGVVSLQNIAFSIALSLPFVEGPPAGVRFALSERAKPFTVSVAPFGGTGFFALEARTDGALGVEAAIEFGGILSLNLLGIVSGGVYLLAGVYIALRPGEDEPDISAFLRLGGYVDVLGIITVSIEFYLGIEYANGELAGVARLTIGVRVLFFSETFSFEIRKKVPHLGALPEDRRRFRRAIGRPEWETYCAAFA